MTFTTVPTTPPATLVAGDSATWDDAAFATERYGVLSAADGWTLAYTYIGTLGKASPTTATYNTTGWRSSLTADQTKSLIDPAATTAAAIRWIAQVSLSGDQVTVADGTLILLPSPADATGGYTSRTESDLTLARNARTELLTSGVTAFQIQGRGVTKNQLAELNKLIAALETRLWRERHPGELGPAIAARFTGHA